MYRPIISGVLPGALTASTLAGPAFLLMVFLGSYVTSLPQTLELSAQDVAQFAMLLLISVLFGFVIALVPNLLGALLMAMLGERLVLARAPMIWATVGAGAGALLALLLDFGQMSFVVVAFAITSAACAATCRAFVRWCDPD